MTGDPLDRHLDALGDALSCGITRADRRRRRRLGVAGGATMLAMVGLGALVAVPGGRTLDPVEDARAAVEAASAAVAEDGNGILHYVVRTTFLKPSDHRGSSTSSSGESPGQEVWMATSGVEQFRVLSLGRPGTCGMIVFQHGTGRRGRASGPVLTNPMEFAQRGRTQTVYSTFSRAAVVSDLPEDSALAVESSLMPEFGKADPMRTIREALAAGRLRALGTLRLDGREVRELVGDDGPTAAEARRIEALPADERHRWRERQRRNGRPTVPTHYRYLVDAASSEPVQLRTERYGVWSRAGGYDHWKWAGAIVQFVRFDRLEDTAATRALLTIQWHANTTIYRGSPDGGFTPRVSFAAATRRERAAMRRCRAARR